MRCWKCGAQNPEDREFCRKCGAELSYRNLDENELPESEEYYDEDYGEDEFEEDEY
ncbi:MAG: zinc-ribbon domain-containing protein [candidate division WOR-3 bacterium]